MQVGNSNFSSLIQKGFPLETTLDEIQEWLNGKGTIENIQMRRNLQRQFKVCKTYSILSLMHCKIWFILSNKLLRGPCSSALIRRSHQNNSSNVQTSNPSKTTRCSSYRGKNNFFIKLSEMQVFFNIQVYTTAETFYKRYHNPLHNLAKCY